MAARGVTGSVAGEYVPAHHPGRRALFPHGQRAAVQLEAGKLPDEAHAEQVLRHPPRLRHHGLHAFHRDLANADLGDLQGGDARDAIGGCRAAGEAQVLREPKLLRGLIAERHIGRARIRHELDLLAVDLGDSLEMAVGIGVQNHGFARGRGLALGRGDGAAEGRGDGRNAGVELGNGGGAEIEAQNADIAALDGSLLNAVVKRLEVMKGQTPPTIAAVQTISSFRTLWPRDWV